MQPTDKTAQDPKLHSPHTPWAAALRTALLASVAVCLVLLAFAWPSVSAKAKDIPAAVIGSGEQIAQLTEKAPRGVLDLRTVATRDEAASQIEKREIYGAIVLGTQTEVLTSSAASPIAAQALNQLGSQMQLQIQEKVIAALQQNLSQLAKAAQAGQSTAATTQTPATQTPAALPTVKVTDVVPFSADDARGAGLAVTGFPLAMGGMIGGLLISLLVSGTWRRLGAALGYAAVGGLGLTLIMQSWLHILQGDFALNWLAIGLGIGAITMTIVGLNALLGRAGIAVGSLLTLFIGNPLSSLTQPKEFLPGPWGEIGQWFVPGSSGTLLRDLSYFPQANVTFPWLLLAGWLVLGALLSMIGHFRDQSAIPSAALEPADVPEEHAARHSARAVKV